MAFFFFHLEVTPHLLLSIGPSSFTRAILFFHPLLSTHPFIISLPFLGSPSLALLVHPSSLFHPWFVIPYSHSSLLVYHLSSVPQSVIPHSHPSCFDFRIGKCSLESCHSCQLGHPRAHVAAPVQACVLPSTFRKLTMYTQ